jgi:GNAT superfamily N-acetyltransferase
MRQDRPSSDERRLGHWYDEPECLGCALLHALGLAAAYGLRDTLPAMTIAVTSARPEDARAIILFNAQMAEETEGRRLDPDTLARGVHEALANPARGQYYVARVDGELVGQMLITHEWSDWRNGSFWWVQSVYVRQDMRKQGVFSALYRHVERLARETPEVCGLRLYVDQHNDKAQQTYLRLGMAKARYDLFEVEF